MNRRGFLGNLLKGAATVAAAPVAMKALETTKDGTPIQALSPEHVPVALTPEEINARAVGMSDLFKKPEPLAPVVPVEYFKPFALLSVWSTTPTYTYGTTASSATFYLTNTYVSTAAFDPSTGGW